MLGKTKVDNLNASHEADNAQQEAGSRVQGCRGPCSFFVVNMATAAEVLQHSHQNASSTALITGMCHPSIPLDHTNGKKLMSSITDD